MLLSTKKIAAISVLFILPSVLAHLIIEDNYRAIIVIFFLPFITYKIVSASTKKIITYIIITAFIPIKLNISTTDIGSISQYICLLGFMAFLGKSYFSGAKLQFNKTILSIVVPLIFIGALSTVSLLPHLTLFRTSFWSFVLLITTVIFLILIDSIKFKDEYDKYSHVIKWIDMIVFCTCAQILLGMMTYYYPETGGWFKIFFSASEQTGLQSTITDNNLIRLRTFSLPTEAVGEFCAMLLPYATYRLSFQKGWLYLPGVTILLAGIILSGTRSGAILAILALLGYYGFAEKSLKIKVLHLSLLATILFMVVAFEIGTTTIMTRFLSTYDLYINNADMGTILNRKFIFEVNMAFFRNNLTLFGNGLISPVIARYLLVDFHNVYMTLIYQFGIIGALFYLILPLSLLKLLSKGLQKYGDHAKLTKVLIISLLIFMVNEIKFEFTRKNDYIIIIWILLSVCYLHTKQFIRPNIPSKLNNE